MGDGCHIQAPVREVLWAPVIAFVPLSPEEVHPYSWIQNKEVMHGTSVEVHKTQNHYLCEQENNVCQRAMCSRGRDKVGDLDQHIHTTI